MSDFLFSGYHALWLDETFMHGKSNPSLTFGNPSLSSVSPFALKHIELWGFIINEKAHLIRKPLKFEKSEDEEDNKPKSILDNKDGAFILDLLGKNYSALVRE